MASEPKATVVGPEPHADFSQFDGLAELEGLKGKIDFWSHLVQNPTARDEMRRLKDQNDGLMKMVIQLVGKDRLPAILAELAGQLTCAITVAGIEKRRGDYQMARAEAAESAKRRIATHTARIVGDWMRFVQSKPEYMSGADWGGENPSYAAVLHSSLLQRMLRGEQPMSDEDYKAWKQTNHPG